MLLRMLLTAQTPLSFRIGRNPARSKTLAYIPGTSIIGGLGQAHHWLGRDADEFAAFFLQERVLFGNCYPADFASSELRHPDHPVLPMPLTARSCKRFPGFTFHAEQEEDPRAGVTDLLIPLALFRMSEEQHPALSSEQIRTIQLQLLAPWRHHCKTGEPLEPISGFFRRGALAEELGRPKSDPELRTRAGINYRTGAARSAILYSRQMLPAQTQFWGEWAVDDQLVDALLAFVAEVEKRGILRVGNNRTRGFGHVSFMTSQDQDKGEVSILVPWSGDTVQALQQRVEDFTRQFKAAAAQAGLAAPAAAYVPITLTSDAVLYDELLRPRLHLKDTDLFTNNQQRARLVFHAANRKQITGWSMLWGLPKVDDWAIGMGSVFLFALEQVDATTWAALLQVQQQGVGERRAEGFGQVAVANPFHLELAGRFL